MKRSEPKAWSNPEPLFNGKNLDGWEPIGDPSKSHWVVKDGLLVNEEHGANLRFLPLNRGSGLDHAFGSGASTPALAHPLREFRTVRLPLVQFHTYPGRLSLPRRRYH